MTATTTPERAVSLRDRITIERTVWALNHRLWDIPWPTRRRIRREVRANLRAAASDGGAAAAVERLGPLHRVAGDYLEAEYAGARPAWAKALFWALAVEILILAVAFAGFFGFASGIEAAEPTPDGSFTWHGATHLGLTMSADYAAGEAKGFTLVATPWFPVWILVAALIGGRSWRFLPRWRRRAR